MFKKSISKFKKNNRFFLNFLFTRPFITWFRGNTSTCSSNCFLLQTIRVQMQPELLSVVDKTTQYLKSNVSTESTENPLLTLIDLVYKQMKMIAEAHALTIKNFQSTLKRYGVAHDLYGTVDFWNQAQTVMQIMLTDYLNIQNVSAEDQLKANFPEQSVNISSFFSRRKPQT